MNKNKRFLGITIATALAAVFLCACEKTETEVIPDGDVITVTFEDQNVVTNPEDEVIDNNEGKEQDINNENDGKTEETDTKEEIDRYAQVPKDELDENGKYIPVDVTADMLRERLDEIENDYEGHEEYVDGVESTILKCNYPFISETDFETIVKEYDINLGLNYIPYYEDYDVEPEKFYFDPYLQYEARIFYDLNYEREVIWQNINDNNGLNNQDDMDLVEEKINCLMLDGKYESEDETILVPFTANDATAKLETNNEKDAKISLSFMLKQYGIAYGNSMEYNDMFDNEN